MMRILRLGLLSCSLFISLNAIAQEESISEVVASSETDNKPSISKEVNPKSIDDKKTAPIVRPSIIEVDDIETNEPEAEISLEKTKNVEDQKPLAPPINPLASSGKVVLALIFIIFLIFILAYLLRRYQQFTPFNTNRSQPLINILSTQPLGVKEKIALIEVGQKQVLVGVTQQSIQSLMVLENDQRVASSNTVDENSDKTTEKNVDGFQDVLRRALMK